MIFISLCIGLTFDKCWNTFNGVASFLRSEQNLIIIQLVANIPIKKIFSQLKCISISNVIQANFCYNYSFNNLAT